ncbi:MAG: M12 family metallo-peptidase [Planctomycetota bacterium]
MRSRTPSLRPASRASLMFGALCVSTAGNLASAQHVAPFPFDVAARAGAFGSFELTPRAGELAALAAYDALELVGVELPDGRVIDLTLQRIEFDFEKVGVQVDGKPMAAWDARDLSVWRGAVLGEAGSEVHLGLATAGSYGWVRSNGEVWQLSSFAPAGGSWDAPASRMWAESAFADLSDPRYSVYCLADRMQAGLGALGPALANPTGGVTSQALGGPGVTLECKVAVETDYQYYQRFGNLNAAQNYVMQLLAAVSDRYRTEIDVVITYPYLQFYTQNNDPWIAGDDPAQYSSGDLLGELRNAWAGNIPAGANIGHIISGAGLGGGVAWVNVLCSQSYGFAASTGVNGGVNFPVSQGSGNWDFIVFSHEMGHQFGTGHTHGYCPTPLDRCAPSAYFGNCQTSQQCTNTGTIMSYCHLCSGGTANITTYFHPTVKDVMRAGAEGSCLTAYTGGPMVCFPDALEPNDTCGTARPLAQGLVTGLEAANDNLDHYRITVPAGGSVVVDVLFAHANGDIDARLYNASCNTVLNSSTSSTDNEQLVWANNSASPVDVVAQVFNYPGVGCFGYDLRVTLAMDPCQSILDDGYEDNDSCAQAVAAPPGLELGMFVSKQDPDFFQVAVAPGANLSVSAYFSHALGDIDVYVYDPSASCGGGANYLARGFSSTDNEVVQWQNAGVLTRDLVVEVQVYSGSVSNCNSYALAIDPGQGATPGTNFCGPAVSNSTGVPGLIGAVGSANVLDNDLVLVGRDLPLLSNGYFIVSPNAGMVLNPGGASGHLCLYPPYGRFIAQTQNSGLTGTVSIPVDLTSLPQPNAPVVVLPGETWRFQLWYRDSLLGVPTSNFTDAVGILFQ